MRHRSSWAKRQSGRPPSMASPSQPPYIYVLAGANGAGKSSIGGAAFLHHGVEYFNPDEAARRILAANPAITQEDANSAAWHEGKRLLERAIAERLELRIRNDPWG